MSLNVVFLPHTDAYKSNPYWAQLQASLEREGATFVDTEDKFYLQWRWLVENRNKVNVLHLHFIQHQYTIKDRYTSKKMLSKFVAKLLLARVLGYEIVWTVHNLYPHERLEPKYIGRLAHLAVAHLSTRVIVHCDFARQALAKEFYRRRNVYAIPHPNYIAAYPNTIGRDDARARLEIAADKKVFLFLGAIRPYKGLNNLVEAFKKLPDEDLTLIIAGKPGHAVTEVELNALEEADPRIRLFPQFVADEELQLFFNAADASVLPFTDVLSSGSALLAMTFGCPVVAPSLGCLTEAIGTEAGILYDPADPDGLFQAMTACLAEDLPRLREQTYERATLFSWELMAEQTMRAYGYPAEQPGQVYPPAALYPEEVRKQ